MLLSVLGCSYKRGEEKLRSNVETKSSIEVGLREITPLEWTLIAVLTFGAGGLAYRCSAPGGARWVKVIFAALFSEFYLIQAGARALIGDNGCDWRDRMADRARLSQLEME